MEDDFGRSDRTQLALAASRLPRARAERLAPLLRRGEVSVVHGLLAGLRFPARALPPGHPHSRLLLLGDLEPTVQEALRRSVAAGMTVFDVGANIGVFALLAARLTGPRGRVLAFEPVPELAREVRAAANRNALAVDVREVAVCDRAGSAALHVVDEPSWSHLADRGHHDRTARTIEVTTVALDDLDVAPDVVKLDVEGSEVAVLDGAAGLLASVRPVWIVECHATNAEVAERLEAADYVLVNLDGPEPVREAGEDVRLIATPREWLE